MTIAHRGTTFYFVETACTVFRLFHVIDLWTSGPWQHHQCMHGSMDTTVEPRYNDPRYRDNDCFP